MKVMFIAAECKPFSKAGGVGDVAGELPLAIKKLGVDIEIVTPLYRKDRADDRHIGKDAPVYEFTVDYDGNTEAVSVYKAMVQGVNVFLVSNPTHFEGKAFGTPYVNSQDLPFADDVRRFAFFSKACLKLIDQYRPDIVHINDWVLGYLFGWMKIEERPEKRVLTIHNVGYQGNVYKPGIAGWPIEEFVASDVTREVFTDPHPDWNSVNALRMALELSDKANTVSPTYCREMTQAEDQSRYFEGGKGLDEVSKGLYEKGRLTGILNGFEYQSEPTEAAFQETLKRKTEEKRALGGYFDEPQSFLLGFVGRAVEQKFKLLSEPLEIDGKRRSVLEHILEIPGVNVAILATGLPEYEAFIGNLSVGRYDFELSYDSLLAASRRKNYTCTVAFDRSMAQKISLGCDVFLMPSLFEPCGITQMECMSVATPPLVRSTGGLADTVVPHDRANGDGFVFNGATGKEVLENLYHTVKTACDVFYNHKEQFEAMEKRAFWKRFLWKDAAQLYVEQLYSP
jgi:starch synthase